MSKLYDRADIYDLIDSDQRTDAIRRDWKEFLDKREIHTMLDVSIGTGTETGLYGKRKAHAQRGEGTAAALPLL